MIARTWHGRVPARRADAYAEYVRRTGLADLARTPGNRGAYLLRRTDGDVAHFVVTSLWDSVDAIRAFAGDDLEVVFYEDDDRFLVDREWFVTHYEIAGP
jgi:heme-degrading monooxygenase HmoA